MTGQRFLYITLFLVVLLIPATGIGPALAQTTTNGIELQAPANIEAAVGGYIPIQGRLTDAGGNSLPDGDYTITFSLYDGSAVGANLLCDDTQTVAIADGLFSVAMGNCTASDINGQELWLGVKVGDDDEMTPRQPIYPAPYAWSLRPGADIDGDVSGSSILALYNSSATDYSKGLYVLAEGLAGKTYGVYASSDSAAGFGGYFSGGAADLVLGGGGGDDNGEIHSDLDLPSSDIVLISNDEVHIHLDENNDEDGSFQIASGAGDQVLGAYETGRVHLDINAGSAQAVAVGDRYRDNAIVAWAKVSADGTITTDYGVASVTRAGVGNYMIEIDAHATSVAALIPIAIAEIETQPDSAAEVRILSINQTADNIFRIYINDGNWNPTDSDFVFMVTAR
jgi:hypothetical protein